MIKTTYELTKEQSELCARIYDETGIEIEWSMMNERPEDIDALEEYMQERAGELEVIYYRTAMEYLMEHDMSLQESLAIAHEYGYTADNINSELLATLLTQRDALEAIPEYRDELEAAFYSNSDME